MESVSVLDRLAANRTLAAVPKDQLAWLASVGELRTVGPGEVLTSTVRPVRFLYVVLEGHLLIRVDGGAGPRIVMEWHGGDVTGVLPYSRIKSPPGEVIAEERTELWAVPDSELPHMIRECHELTAVLVHVMLDRARVFTSSQLLDEKMASLGRLAAGLAHELNNPASAVARSAKTLVGQLNALDVATRRYCGLNLSESQRRTITDLRDRRPADAGPTTAALELADWQDALDAWLGTHHVDNMDVAPLVDAGFRPADLDAIATLVGADKIGAVLEHIATGQSVRQLAEEIETAATRIHSLVAAVKGFTYVNQQATLQPVTIGRGLADSVTVLRSKAKANSVEVSVHVADHLPDVDGYGGELNQVWSNLLDNAIDATPGGHVTIDATADGAHVVVRVVDDGPGIPPDVQHRIFDPFFTTKAIGQGTGLGLDIARRIVQRHRGAIGMNTGSGGTEFRVTLPASTSAGDATARQDVHSS
jgi:signal transduction histidine kinase